MLQREQRRFENKKVFINDQSHHLLFDHEVCVRKFTQEG